MKGGKRTRTEESFRRLLDSALDAVITMNAQGLITGWNPQAETIFGWSREKAIGRRLGETIIPPQYREAHHQGLQHFLATGEGPVLNKRIEITALHRDGHEFPVELTISPLRSGETFTFSAFIRDITERKRAEEALRQKTGFVELLQTVAVAANEASTFQDALQYAVDQVCAHTGWPVGDVYLRAESSELELVPTGIWHLKNPKQFETFRKVTDATSFARGVGLPGRVLATGKPAWIIDVTKDSNFPRAKLAEDIGVKAGFGFPVLVGTEVVAVLEFFSAEAMEPDEPLLEVMGHIGTQLGRVIERMRAEEALQRAKDDLEVRVQERTAELTIANVEIQETRQYLEGLIESSPDAIMSTDKEGNVVLFNEGAEAILGFQREEIIGQRVSLVYESVERAKELMRLMRKQGGTVSAFETILRAKDGSPIPVMISASILYDEQGQEAGTVGFNKDLRPLKQAEEELRRAKAQIQALRIEIDQTKRARRVSEITESDYFQDLEKKVEELRDRSTPEPA